MKTYTKGNVIVEEIKVGDIHYEYEYGLCVKSQVITMPVKNDDGVWEWESKKISSEEVIHYLVNPKYSHYSSNLYDHEAYQGCKMI